MSKPTDSGAKRGLIETSQSAPPPPPPTGLDSWFGASGWKHDMTNGRANPDVQWSVCGGIGCQPVVREEPRAPLVRFWHSDACGGLIFGFMLGLIVGAVIFLV